MKNSKININWYFLIAGLLIIYPVLFNVDFSRSNELEKLDIQLDNKIEKLKGRKSLYDYYFFTKQYKNNFIILNGVLTDNKKRELLNSIKNGQRFEIRYQRRW